MPIYFRRYYSYIVYPRHFWAAETQTMWTAFIDFCVLQYDNIDAEHKAIFECIFNCSKDPKSAPLISKLYQVTEDHFKDEEVLYHVLLLYHWANQSTFSWMLWLAKCSQLYLYAVNVNVINIYANVYFIAGSLAWHSLIQLHARTIE